MPPLKSVSRLEKLCSRKFSNHLFTLFSSWYKSRNCTEDTWIIRQIDGDRIKYRENETIPDFSDCYYMEGGTSVIRNRWFLDFLTEGKMEGTDDSDDGDDYKYVNCSQKSNGQDKFLKPDLDEHEEISHNLRTCEYAAELGALSQNHDELEEVGSVDDDCISYVGDRFQNPNALSALPDQYEAMEEGHKDDSDWDCEEYRNPDALSPVPNQHQTESPLVLWLSSQVKDFLICHLPPRFYEEILETLINMIAQKVDFPRPKEKMRDYEEDLDFINSLGFLLKVSLRCLLTKDVMSVDFTSVAHLVKKWKLLCWGGKTVRGGDFCQSPYFDIFSYALDISLPGLRTLKQLKLPHFVHNSFVRKVAFLCPNLEVLILRCSADCTNPKHTAPVVTNLEVLYLNTCESPDTEMLCVRGCQNLVTLVLPEGVENTDINHDVTEMLSYMNNLQYLIGVPMLNLFEKDDLDDGAIDEMIKGNKLTNFHHGAYDNFNWPPFVYDAMMEGETDFSCFLKLPKLFSHVKEVGIYAPAEVTEMVLQSFPTVKDITIFTDDFGMHGQFLNNLTSLDINVGYQMVWPILTSLSQSSSNLERLTLRSFSLQLTEFDNPELRFSSLQTLRFHGQNVLEGNALLAFLRGCPVLSTFVLSMLTDEDGDQQLDNVILQQALPMFYSLQKFVYKVQCALSDGDDVPSKLTIDSCWALINACPQLTYIGQLETWKVTRAEIDQLHRDVRKRNWDLEIV